MLQTPEIKQLQDRAIDLVLLVFTILGAATFVLIYSTTYKNGYANKADVILQFAIVLTLILISILRHKISKKIKISALIAFVTLISFSNMLTFGLISNAKILLVIFPAFLSFVSGWGLALAVLLFYVALYGIFGWLFQSGILSYQLNFAEYYAQPGPWMVAMAAMVIGSLGLLLIGHHYTQAMQKNFLQLQNTNAELYKHEKNLQELVTQKTHKLDESIEELKQLNSDLQEKNAYILQQNSELEATLLNLQQAQQQLIQSEKMASLGVLTAGVAHEINNPLNFIASGYHILHEYASENCLKSDDKEMLESALKAINEGIKRAGNIVSSLNQFNRNNDNLNENIDIKDVLDNCVLILSSKLESRIRLTKNYAVNLPIIKGNSGKLHQVFMNLILNAIQAISGDGAIAIKAALKGNNLHIEIKDNGQGIRQEHLHRITEPFFTTKEPGIGTGLGLSISYAIVKDHRGRIYFESEWQKGTSAFVELPIKF